MIKGKDPRPFLHGHEFRYGNSTDFRCHQGLIGKTVRSFSGESTAHAGGDHAAFVAVDVEAVGGVRGRVQGDAKDVGVAGDGVADPASVVVGEGGAVGGQHQPMVGVPAQVPDGCPPGGAAALPVPRRHRQHHLDAFSGCDPLEGAVDEVQVAGLHLLAVREDRGQCSGRTVHGNLPLHDDQLGPEFR